MPGVLTAAAAFSSTRSPSSFVTPGCTAPNTRTELRCWNRVSARGAVVASMRVNVETGTSWPEGVLIFRSSSGPTVFRSSRSEEHTSELQSRENLVCRLLLEKKKKKKKSKMKKNKNTRIYTK